MKTLHVVLAIFALGLFGCSPKTVDVVEVHDKETPLNLGKLECVSLGEDEFGAPRNEVQMSSSDKPVKVGECLACEQIPQEAFEGYQIPKDAISACGGWWAGGGDYFYSKLSANGKVEVYIGWQDEGQEDDGYHWELKGTYPN